MILIKRIKKDVKSPFLFKKSIHFNDENIIDYVFKGYVSVYEVNIEKQIVIVFAFIKYKDSL